MKPTIMQIEDFRDKNVVWEEIYELLVERIDQLHSLLEVAPKETIWTKDDTGKTVAIRGCEYYQGQIEEVRELLTLPDKLINDIKGQAEGESDE